MSKSVRRALIGAAALSAAALTGATAVAEEFPEREVTLFVNYGAGGAVDRTARSVQPFLPDALGQSVVVENVGGAGGRTGLRQFMSMEPDGYTVLVAFAPATTYAKHTDPDIFAMEDLAVLNVQWADPAIIVARRDTGWTSLADMIEAVRAEPGRFAFGSSGSGSVGPVLAGELFNALDLDLKIVPYSGGGATRRAFLAGEVELTAAGAGGATSIRDDSVVLGAFWSGEVPGWPDAQPINPQLEPYGVSVPEGGAYRFFAVHADVAENHPERFQALAEALEATVTSEPFLAAAAESGVGTDWLGPQAGQALIEDVDARFDAIFKAP